MISGALRFAIVSLCAFWIWAVGPIPKSMHPDEKALFIQCGLVFIMIGGILLPGLVHPPDRRRKFNRSFPPAFIAYAVAWSACWFALHSRAAEWLGLLAGCAVFALILGRRLGAKSGFGAVAPVLFVANSVGYFLGGFVFSMARHPPSIFADWKAVDIWTLAKLAWGLFFGLGFGAGIGYAFFRFQAEPTTPSQT